MKKTTLLLSLLCIAFLFGGCEKERQNGYVTLGNIMVQTKDLGETSFNSAAQLCNDSSVGGFTDWRLPTKGELAMIYENRTKIGGLKKRAYWFKEVNTYYVIVCGYMEKDGLSKDLHDCDSYSRAGVRAVRTITQ